MKTKELGKKVWKEIERPQGYAFISDAIEEMDDKRALALIKISLQWNEIVIEKLKEIIKAAESKELQLCPKCDGEGIVPSKCIEELKSAEPVEEFCECENPIPQATLSHACQKCFKTIR